MDTVRTEEVSDGKIYKLGMLMAKLEELKESQEEVNQKASEETRRQMSEMFVQFPSVLLSELGAWEEVSDEVLQHCQAEKNLKFVEELPSLEEEKAKLTDSMLSLALVDDVFDRALNAIVAGLKEFLPEASRDDLAEETEEKVVAKDNDSSSNISSNDYSVDNDEEERGESSEVHVQVVVEVVPVVEDAAPIVEEVVPADEEVVPAVE